MVDHFGGSIMEITPMKNGWTEDRHLGRFCVCFKMGEEPE